MGGGQTISGPDLGAGLAAEELPEGGVIAGQVGGEAVVLVRHGGRCFAVGGSCSHYGGPLGEGLFKDGELHCPWHHARFDVSTGEALAGPAMNPLPCFEVREEAGRVRVVGRRDAATTRTGPIEAPESVVIVGSGPAALFAAERLSREGYRRPITMITAEAGPPVDRPNLSKDYLAGNAPEDWIPVKSADALRELGVTLRDRTRVTGIDPCAREVLLSDGSRERYGALLLATGASPVRLELPGSALPHVFTLRTHADSNAIIERAKASRMAVVIGASFIGLEVAASLRARGLQVVVVAPDEVPLARVLGPEVGAFVKRLHEDRGVQFRLGHKPASISESDVTLDSGERITADLVVMGVGVRPNTELAERAGCRVDRGVLVNELLQTSVPGIFAAGDIARFPHDGASARIEHWVVAARMGAAAALNILGRGTPFREVPFFWSQHYDVPINYVGHGDGWDSYELAGNLDARSFLVAYRRAKRIVAIASVYRDRDSLLASDAFKRGDQETLERLLAAAR